MTTEEITFVLARQVPDMARGFTIGTNSGVLTIEPGPLADRIAKHVRKTMAAELDKAARAANLDSTK